MDSFLYCSDRSGIRELWQCRRYTRDISPLNTEINLYDIHFVPHRERRFLQLVRPAGDRSANKMALYCKIYTGHSSCGRKNCFFVVKPGGTYSNHISTKSQYELAQKPGYKQPTGWP